MANSFIPRIHLKSLLLKSTVVTTEREQPDDYRREVGRMSGTRDIAARARAEHVNSGIECRRREKGICTVLLRLQSNRWMQLAGMGMFTRNCTLEEEWVVHCPCGEGERKGL